MFKQLPLSAYSGRSALLDNEEYLIFTGTSYLGILQNTTFQQYLIEGFNRYGTNYGSSRNGNVVFPVFAEAENKLAQLIGSEASLTLSSGMLAGQVLLRQFEEHAHLFISPGIHPALKPLNYRENHYNYAEWTNYVLTELHQHKSPEAVIFLNTIDILHAKRYDLQWLESLPDDLNLIVVIDDSHGLGLIGKNGEGHFSLLPVRENIEPIMVSSMGKALGIPAGVIAANENRINKLRQSGIFGGSSPAVPAYLHAFLNSIEIYNNARKHLKNLTNQFREKTATIKDSIYSDDLPVFFMEDKKVARQLMGEHIILSSFPYPTPESELIIRVVINSCHSSADIDQLATALNNHLKIS